MCSDMDTSLQRIAQLRDVLRDAVNEAGSLVSVSVLQASEMLDRAIIAYLRKQTALDDPPGEL